MIVAHVFEGKPQNPCAMSILTSFDSWVDAMQG